MKLLSRKEVKELLVKVKTAANNYKSFSGIYEEFHKKPAKFFVPCGELANKNIAGFVWALNMKNQISAPMRITEKDKFEAQGIEGKVEFLNVDLMDCLIYAGFMEPGRYNIYT